MGIYSGYKLRNPDIRKFMDVVTGHDHDGTNSKSISAVASIPNDSITNAKLATTIKVGALADLTTTEKATLVGAVNEVDGHADAANTAIGTLASLTTTEQGSVVGAINEVDSNADAANTAIGTLASLTTTAKTSVVAAVNELDADMVNIAESASDAAADAASALAAVSGKASLTGEETLTNKTLTTPILASFYQDAGKTKLMTTPDTASDTLAALAATQTFTNKTYTAPIIATGDAIVDAGGDEYLKFVEATTPVTYVQITSGDTGVAPRIQGAGEAATDLHLLGTGTGNVVISDGTDPTKDMVFELSGATADKTVTITSSQTDDRAITLPDATTTLVGTDTADTLTNKTLTSPTITTMLVNDGDAGLTITSADQTDGSATATVPDIGGAADNFVMEALAQTLTNKTLTSAVMTTMVIDDSDAGLIVTSADQTNAAATATIPDIGDAADEFVMKDTAQTLTQKTLTSPVITTPDLTYSIAAHDYGGGHADWTLSASEKLARRITVTNVDTAAAIIAPAENREYVVYNGSGENVTIKVAAGAGVTIATLKTAIVMYDGSSDYVRVTADV